MYIKQPFLAHFSLFIACLAWGGSYAVGRFGLSEGSSLWLTLWRWGPGAILFVVYLAIKWREISPIINGHWLKLVLISALGVVIYPVTLFMAISQTTALNASLYLAVTPILIVLASSIFWQDKLGKVGLGSVFLGLLGALILLFQGSIDSLIQFKFAENDLWAIISAFAWVGYCVALPLKPNNLNEIPFLALIVVIGSIILLVFGLTIGAEVPQPNTSSVALSIAYFAVFPSILAFFAWNWGTLIVGSSTAAPYNNLVPLFGGILGVVFLGETVEEYHIIGGALIIVGLMVNGLYGKNN